ncbi:MAG: AAA family ATPase [Magnetococcales bacterium]|nr:AAA family ATPase [Magnetococcales bacterium]
MLHKIKLEKFTAFESLEVTFSSGLNILIGANGTGKTHILKVLYAACDITKSKKSLSEKINKVFLPSGEQIGRLAKRKTVSTEGSVEVIRHVNNPPKPIAIRLRLSNHTKTPDKATVSGAFKQWLAHPLESVYIPVKDMMANAPGFRSLYELRDIHFEEIYADIISRASLPLLRGGVDTPRKSLLEILQKAMNGKVIQKNEEFFLKNEQGELEFTLLAEGMRKLALLWLLIQNGTLLQGSVLFWDEPETNLNPRIMKTIVEILLELQRMGVQIFLTTHDYIILKEVDLQTRPGDDILYHSLYRDPESHEIQATQTKHYLEIAHNTIDEAFGDIMDRDMVRSMGTLGR